MGGIIPNMNRVHKHGNGGRGQRSGKKRGKRRVGNTLKEG